MINTATDASLLRAWLRKPGPHESVNEPIMQLETVETCDICGAATSNTTESVEVRDPFHVSDETFRYERCGQCATWLQNPRPVESELGPFYDTEFVPDKDQKSQSFFGRIALKFRDFKLYYSDVGWLLKHLKPNAVYLDYSAGDGQVIEMVRRYWPDVETYVTEFSPTYREMLQQYTSGEAVRTDIDDFDPELRFDVISALGVLEHVYSPTELIQKFHARLPPGGKVVITVPNPDSWQRRLAGKHWWSWLAPRHMYLMDIRTMTDLFERNGFDVIDRKAFLLRYSPMTLVLSAFPNLDPIKVSGWRLVLMGALFILAIPVEWIASWFFQSGFMGVVAQKRNDT